MLHGTLCEELPKQSNGLKKGKKQVTNTSQNKWITKHLLTPSENIKNIEIKAVLNIFIFGKNNNNKNQ